MARQYVYVSDDKEFVPARQYVLVSDDEEFVPAVLDDCQGTIDCKCEDCERLPAARKKIVPTAVVLTAQEKAKFHPAFAVRVVTLNNHEWIMPEDMKDRYFFAHKMPEFFRLMGEAGAPILIVDD
jgi:hypothetical protein